MNLIHLSWLLTTLPYAVTLSTINHFSTSDYKSLRYHLYNHPHLHSKPSTTLPPRYNNVQQKDRFKGSHRLLSSVAVYDGTFSPSTCEELHHLAVDHCTRGDDGSSLFVRPPHNDRPLTPLENAIDSALVAMGDYSKKVEYWSRDEFMNIDVHADIDEVQLEEGDNDDDDGQSGLLRCPKMGHVLYLMVEDGLRCPTCVFPDKRAGWNFLNGEDFHHIKMKNGQERQPVVELVTIPAVQGRILRFPGSAMHSVPKPTQRWFLSRDEEQILRREEEGEAIRGDGDDDDYDDDDDESDDWTSNCDDYYGEDSEEENVERSVLLFNTWPDEQPGPRGVSGDYISGAIPDGIEIDENFLADFAKTNEAQQLLEWEEEYGKNAEALHANPRLEWKQINIHSHSGSFKTENGKVNPSLMGNQKRRVSPKKFVCLTGPTLALQEALQEEEKVWQFQMNESH